MTNLLKIEKLNLITGIALGISGMQIAVAPQAAALPPPPPMAVECPTQISSSRSTERLSSPWRVGTQTRRLQSIRVERAGGRQTLVCDYGKGGKIWRYAPSGFSCFAPNRSTVFACNRRIRPSTPPPRPPAPPRSDSSDRDENPGTFTTGPITLQSSQTADLDRGTKNAGSASDIWYEGARDGRFYITPRNGAKIAVGNRSNRGYAGCSRAAFTSARVWLNRIPVGSYICVKTNKGRISQFRMNDKIGSGAVTLKLGYTTWNR